MEAVEKKKYFDLSMFTVFSPMKKACIKRLQIEDDKHLPSQKLTPQDRDCSICGLKDFVKKQML